MCGIAGFVDFSESSKKLQILSKMLKKIDYRGPDEVGKYVDQYVALGINRLSVIDVRGGSQPFFSEDKCICSVFNGEIYNYQTLRNNLIQKGHKLKSFSDSEVLVHLYEDYGEKFIEKLEGMFAFALWDKRMKKLILSRDRCGEKPLYYGVFGSAFIFGSELKALLEHTNTRREINIDALNAYLAFEYVPTPLSIIKGIYKLEPGYLLVLKEGKIQKKKYWDFNFSKSTLSFDDSVIEFEKLLNDSVRDRLISDVPLGVFLSGGIDSSSIAYFAAKNSKKKIKSFSIGFEDKTFDESRYAMRVAKSLHLEHHHKTFKEKDLLDLIPEISKNVDEPFADASLLPTYLLSKFARKKVTVVLGGDGADELLGGYPTFNAHRLAKFYTLLPEFFHNYLVLPLSNKIPTSFSYLSFDFKIKRFLSTVYDEPLVRNQKWLGAFPTKEQRRRMFLRDKWICVNNKHLIGRNLDSIKSNNMWNRLTYAYLRGYLLDDILVKVDRASMFNSLEVRAPFLDTRLINFLNSLPFEYKNNGFQSKIILKRVMQNKLPREIIMRKKHGFGIPISNWLAGKLRPILQDMLSEKVLKRDGLFNHRYVESLMQEHFDRRRDNRKELWALLMFQFWRANWNE